MTKILAIDDTLDNLVVLKALLSESFPEALFYQALSGASGIQLCESVSPDVILLDLVMPGMDGYEVLSRLKNNPRYSYIPIIILTAARSDKNSRIQALDLGADAFLVKPVDEAELTAQIRAMLRIKESEDLKRDEAVRLNQLVIRRTQELENELQERKKTENELRKALEKVDQSQRASLNLLEDLKTEIDVRKNTEAILREREEKLARERILLKTLIDHLPHTVYVKDRNKRKILANKADLALIGKSEEEVIGKTDLEVFPSSEASNFDSDDDIVLNTKQPLLDREEMIKNPEGRNVWLLTSKVPLYDHAGNLTGLIGIGHDMTKRKQVEEELVKAKEKAEESDRLKTAFLHNISHEIRTPLNAIIGFSSMLSNPELPAQKREEFMQIVNVSCDQLLSIISGIIALSTLEAGQERISEKETDLNQILLNVYEQLQVSTFSSEIEFGFKPGLPDENARVITDPVKLMQILVNLVGNALKFTHSGKVEFGYRLTGDMIEFYVEDTGIGIAKEMHSLIFERFRQADNSATRKYGGTGLGLALSKGYVELLEGTISLKSQPGKGSVFSFTLPYKPIIKPIIDVFETRESNVQLPSEKTILVAEDELNNFRLINEMLSMYDMNIVHAENGLEAVNICNGPKIPDLVLMDIKMPVMDGIEATKKIKKHNARLPVIAITAYAHENDRKRILESGCDDYLVKPINFSALSAALHRFLV